MVALDSKTSSRAVFGRKGRSRVAGCLLGVGLLLWAAPCRAQSGGTPTGEEAVGARPPTPEQLFQIQSEKAFRHTLREEARKRPGALPVIFPEEPPVKEQPYPGRSWPHQVRYTVPGYVCYGRLLFEQINLERYGWSFGCLTPIVSAGAFYYDVAALPCHAAACLCQHCECSAGYCLPGDPVPLLLYPPELKAFGLGLGHEPAGR
jgi:hypothetical protein